MNGGSDKKGRKEKECEPAQLGRETEENNI